MARFKLTIRDFGIAVARGCRVNRVHPTGRDGQFGYDWLTINSTTRVSVNWHGYKKHFALFRHKTNCMHQNFKIVHDGQANVSKHGIPS